MTTYYGVSNEEASRRTPDFVDAKRGRWVRERSDDAVGGALTVSAEPNVDG